MKHRNSLLFWTSCGMLVLAWLALRGILWPPQELPPDPAVEEAKAAEAVSEGARSVIDAAEAAVVKLPAAGWDAFAERVIPPLAPQGSADLVTLGDTASNSPFHLRVLIDPRGAGVRSVVLNKFGAANDLGRPEFLPANDGDKPHFKPLELIPEAENTSEPSFLLYHFDPNDSAAERPFDTLGVVVWHKVGDVTQVKNDKDEVVSQSVAFEYVLDKEDVKITKVFSLKTGEYHVGLEVRIERLPDRPARAADKNQFRYQLAGAKGLPIEGKWYTSIFRNALILRTDKDNNVYRTLEDSRQIGIWGGGSKILKEGDKKIRYAGVAVQFFASVIVVSDQQQEGTGQEFLARARPTLETGVTKGIIKQVRPGSFTLEVEGHAADEEPTVFYASNAIDVPAAGTQVAVISSLDGRGHDVVRSINTNPAMVHPSWEDDITVRVNTDALELTRDKPIVHRYLLYNGPVKPRLLAQMTGVNAVDGTLLDRYNDDLGLRTLTDYQSNGWMGSFASSIGWTWLVIKCTNLMHLVLGLMHHWVPNLGLSIILLTVMVRGMMFPISRKGAMTSLRMQELAPEMAKIKEKFGDDRQAAGVATMELYRKNGVNPFGTCWFMLLQMPIFMGLYFALQESITFRLAPFWPTWIENLAAPDMMINWGTSIPFINRVEYYGYFTYLGPYLNLLPIVAVALMVVQQKMVTPPPTDEQQEMQQKMMKYMMVIMGFMFYKVAAGLAVYFIASSVWGFTERALLPKKKKTPDQAPPPNPGSPVESAASMAAVSSASVLESGGKALPAAANSMTIMQEPRGRGRKQGRNKRNRVDLTKPAAPPPPVVEAPAPTGPLGRMRAWMRQKRERFAEWWRDLLEQAEKKNRTERKK